ncbi:hypothetical protein AWB71_05638 [Caballeronia peredens]|nr:hypothetical protein AWB71_05638 [Caballeronia peredens]
MKTDDLINVLASGVVEVDRTMVRRRFAKALLCGVAGSLLVMSIVFGFRHDLASVARTGVFWAKLAFPSAISLGALLTIERVGRPGARIGLTWCFLVLPFLVVSVAG